MIGLLILHLNITCFKHSTLKKRSHPEKYPEYVTDKTGLYCKVPNVPTYIHDLCKYFLLKKEYTNKITRNAEGTEVVMSFNNDFWEHDGTQFYMTLTGLWEGVKDRLCDSLIKMKTNVEKGENYNKHCSKRKYQK